MLELQIQFKGVTLGLPNTLFFAEFILGKFKKYQINFRLKLIYPSIGGYSIRYLYRILLKLIKILF
ncbi:MAG TPA: hypothetical protein DCZ88_02950 [Pseudanabaena sp.]|nr:hypothetical protein [Pseudanabaena sp.]